MARVYYYEDDPLKTHESLARYAFAFLRLNKEMVVLDLGCGARRGPFFLARGAREVTGLDVSEEAIAFCRSQWPSQNVKYVCGDALALPFSDRFFDAVVSFEVLEHVRDHELFLKEIRRVLKDDGLCVLSTPNRVVMSPEGVFGNPDHVKEFSAEELRKVLSGMFGRVQLYGQIPSERVVSVLECRQESYREVLKIPVFLRHFVPSSIKRFLFKATVFLFSRSHRRVLQDEIGEVDFPVSDTGLERAHYLVAVCQP